ncbi:hypothetical protein [Tomitella biformata]|uniref:hypothetical protein n=1 Tax=Tomitella biformata TaxID=630403 RepID=UPI0011DCACBA|nr:hypothetical protein [Tomitella biformata]
MSHTSEPHAAALQSNASAARSTTVSSVLIWLGVALFAVGLLSILVTFAVPLFHWRLSAAFYYLAMMAPAGMVIGVIGALASGRRVRN